MFDGEWMRRTLAKTARGRDTATERTQKPGLRERKKQQTRDTIRRHAIRLFLAQGFEATTVEEIAAAANVSHMTFFRYFPSKQDVVDDGDDGDELVRLITCRPVEEAPLTAVRRATLELFDQTGDRDDLLDIAQLILANPPLRSWLWEKHRARERRVAEALAGRQPELGELGLAALAAACVAVTGAAMAQWAASNGTQDLRALLDQAFDALHTAARHD